MGGWPDEGLVSAAEPEFVQFKLRISPELKLRIERAAAASGRSVNRESIARLEASLDRDGGKSNSTNETILEKIAAILTAAAAAAGPSWTENTVAWELIRSTVDHVLRGWEPWEEEQEEQELTVEATKAFQRWKSATGNQGKSPAEVEAELRELKLRQEVIGLTAEEEERLSTLHNVSSEEFNFDGLTPADRKALQRRIKAEQIRAEFWRRISPLFDPPPEKEKFRPRRRAGP